MNTTGYIYLASPYTDPEPNIREERYHKICQAASILALHKIPCYAPIAMWHPISCFYSLPKDYEFWQAQDEAFMTHAVEGWFLQIKGADESKGMKAEREFLSNRKIPCIPISLANLDRLCKIYLGVTP